MLKNLLLLASTVSFLILFLIQGCQTRQLQLQNQELKAQYQLTQAKEAHNIFVIDSLTTHSKVLSEENLTLMEENSSLKLSKRKPIYITKYKDRIQLETITDTQIIRDTISLPLDSLPLDTLPTYVGEYYDEWVGIKSTSTPTLTSYELAVKNDISISHTSKSRFLRPTLYEVFAKNNNPYSIDSAVTSYKIPTKSYFLISPAITYAYDPFSQKAYPGIGISLSHSNIAIKIPTK